MDFFSGGAIFLLVCWLDTVACCLSSWGTLVSSTTWIGTDRAGFVSYPLANRLMMVDSSNLFWSPPRLSATQSQKSFVTFLMCSSYKICHNNVSLYINVLPTRYCNSVCQYMYRICCDSKISLDQTLINIVPGISKFYSLIT